MTEDRTDWQSNGKRKKPCGYRNDPRRNCHCNVPQIEKYMAKISGPLLDRIDIHIEVPGVAFKELSNSTPGTSSATMREQVAKARAAQTKRFAKSPVRRNAQMTSRLVRQYCQLDEEGHGLMKACMAEMGLSARAHDKILRVARTIADLEGNERVLGMHVSEAINYRMLDRNMWK